MIWDLESLFVHAFIDRVHAFIDRRTTVIVETEIQMPSTAHFFPNVSRSFTFDLGESLWPHDVRVFYFYFLATNMREGVYITPSCQDVFRASLELRSDREHHTSKTCHTTHILRV